MMFKIRLKSLNNKFQVQNRYVVAVYQVTANSGLINPFI